MYEDIIPHLSIQYQLHIQNESISFHTMPSLGYLFTSTVARELIENGQDPENPVVNCARGVPYSKCFPKPLLNKCNGVYSRGCSNDSTP
ncbi:hypothetical protein V6N13_121688 [Hibiscus sabdariffa]